MAQVINKYAKGGVAKTPVTPAPAVEVPKVQVNTPAPPAMLKRENVGEYKLDDVLSTGYKGIDDYIKNEGLTGDKATSFRNSANQFLTGLKDGSVQLNSDGSFKDTRGFLNGTGSYDRNFLGVQTNSSNNANIHAATYLKGIVDTVGTYKAPEVKKEDYNFDLKKSLSGMVFGGNTFDDKGWYMQDAAIKKTGTRGTSRRASLIADAMDAEVKRLEDGNQYINTNWGDSTREKKIAALKNAAIRLRDGKFNDDDVKAGFAAGLGDLSPYLSKTLVTKEAATAAPTQGTTPTNGAYQGTIDSTYTNPGFTRTKDANGQYRLYDNQTQKELTQGLQNFSSYDPVNGKYADSVYYNGHLYTKDEYNKMGAGELKNSLAQIYSSADKNRNIYASDPLFAHLRGQNHVYFDKIRDASAYFNGLGQGNKYNLMEVYNSQTGTKENVLMDRNTGQQYRGKVNYNKIDGTNRFVDTTGKIYDMGTYNNAGTYGNVDQFSFSDISDKNAAHIFSRIKQTNNGWATHGEATRQMVVNTLKKMMASPSANRFIKTQGNTHTFVDPSGTGQIINFTTDANGNINFGGPGANKSKIESASDDYFETNPQMKPVVPAKKAEGGVLEFAAGGGLNSLQKVTGGQAEVNNKAVASYGTDKTKTTRQVFGSDNTIENAGGVIKTSDKIRLASAMTDLAGVGLGFVPGANLASAGTGLIASVGDAIADYKDDASFGDIAWNLTKNVGMDALSLIPVGKTLKATKALGKIAKSLPLILTAVNAATTLGDANQRNSIIQSLTKVKNLDFGSLSTSDYKNITAALGLVLGAKNVASVTNNKLLRGSNPSGKVKANYTTKDGLTGSIELEGSALKGLSKEAAIAKARAAALEHANSSKTGDKVLTIDDINVDTHKLPGFKPSLATTKVASTIGRPNWLQRRTPNLIDPSAPKAFGQGTWLANQKWTKGKDGGIKGLEWLGDKHILNNTAFGRWQIPEQTPPTDAEVRASWKPGEPTTYQDGPMAGDKVSPNRNGLYAYDSPLAIYKGKGSPTYYKGAYKNRVLTPGQQQYMDAYIQQYPETVNAFKNKNGELNQNGLFAYIQKMKKIHGVLSEKQGGVLKAASGIVLPKLQGVLPGSLSVPTSDRTPIYINTNDVTGQLPSPNRGLRAPVLKLPPNVVYANVKPVNNPNLFKEIAKKTPIKPMLDTNLFNSMKTKAAGDMQTISTNNQLALNNKMQKDLGIKSRVGSTINPSNEAKETGIAGWVNSHKINPVSALAATRAVMGLATNKKATDLYIDGLRPTLSSAPQEVAVPLQGDYLSKTGAQIQASQLVSNASKPMTSNAALQTASQQEAMNKGAELGLKGSMADAEAFYKSREMGVQNEMQNAGQRAAVANQNAEKVAAIEEAKGQIRSGQVSANYQGIVAPYLAGIEQQHMQNNAMKQQLDLESMNQEASMKFQPEYTKLSDDYDVLTNEWTNWDTLHKGEPKPTSFQTWDKYKALATNRTDVGNRYQQFINNGKRTALLNNNIGFFSQVNPNLTSKVTLAKNGSTLTAADKKAIATSKLFNKNIESSIKLFQKSITEAKKTNNKQIQAMSSTTASLIKKGMSWK